MKIILKAGVLILAIIPVLIVLLVVTQFIITPMLNNITLNSFSKQIYNCPLPQSTELIEKEAICGKLSGNGNGMDFLAGILVKSDMPIDQLIQYYSNKKFKPAKKVNDHIIDINIMPAKAFLINDEYSTYRQLDFGKLLDVNDYYGYFIIMIYDGGYSADFDVRGH